MRNEHTPPPRGAGQIVRLVRNGVSAQELKAAVLLFALPAAELGGRGNR